MTAELRPVTSDPGPSAEPLEVARSLLAAELERADRAIARAEDPRLDSDRCDDPPTTRAQETRP